MTIDSSIGSGVEIGQLHEALVAFFDFGKRHVGQPFNAEIFDGKRRHDRTVNDRPAQSTLA